MRHAEAQNIWVALSRSTELIELTIWDDGRGFDLSVEAQSGHYGMAGMAERASVIGGTLTIESVPTEGTQIRLTVPVKRSA